MPGDAIRDTSLFGLRVKRLRQGAAADMIKAPGAIPKDRQSLDQVAEALLLDRAADRDDAEGFILAYRTRAGSLVQRLDL